MLPYINVFGRLLPMYALMAIVGIFAAGIFVCRQIRKRGLDDNDAIVFLLVAALGVLLGGHLLYGITNLSDFSLFKEVTDIKSFFKTAQTIFGGSVFFGGLIGGTVSGLLYLKIKKMPIPLYLDIMAAAVPLLHGFARIGCFCGGCCYGIESKFGFTFTNAAETTANGVSRFPVQLLESACEFIIFFVILNLFKKEKFKGKLFAVYLILYSIVRFFDEFLRGDAIRGKVLIFSTSQFICLIVFVLSVSFLVYKKIKSNSKTV